MSKPSIAATDALVAAADGGSGTIDRLLALAYDELRRLARHHMNGERPNHTLQPTALVHEAYLKMIAIDRVDWRGKTHFFAVAATQMRRVLLEHARRAAAQKRDGGLRRVTLSEVATSAADSTVDLLALDLALNGLAEANPRQARVAELRVFAGLSVKEVARAIGVTDRTVKRDWVVARAWLSRELRSGADDLS